ncbi:MAG: 1-(5-phosphoribosyl)-5-[(5-phosphoribosylamino)methylideneamino]imidazole-4-carboxamide isomerase [bacterium]
MLIMPAIDIRNGRSVMLTQGKKDKETVFSEDPVITAQKWISQGALRLHIVDLDGAFSGKLTNLRLIDMIKKAHDIPIQLGGGIRDMHALDCVISCGVDYAIIGTAAIKDPVFLESAVQKYPDKIIAAVDVNKGKVAVSGWQSETSLDAVYAGKNLERKGIKTILYTDIEKDGMMQGPNFAGIADLAENLNMEIIPSGGFSSIDDIVKLNSMNLPHILGVVLGKAIYLGNIHLKEAIEICSPKE